MISSSAEALGYSKPVTISNVSYVRYHEITQTPSTKIDIAQVRMYFSCAGSDDQVKNLVPISVAKDNGLGAWTDLNDVPYGYSCSDSYWGNDLSGTFTSFTGAKFVLANTGNPVVLPVTLMNFSAQPDAQSVNLSWSTASENNSDYFSVERSHDSFDFEAIGKMTAAGNSSTEKHYQLVDENPYSGTSFYRLAQTDKNGQTTYSDVVSVKRDNANLISVFPNPASEYLNVHLSGSKDKESVVIIRDILGKECYSQKITPSSDNETIRINLPEMFVSGIYSVTAMNDEKISKEKIIIK